MVDALNLGVFILYVGFNLVILNSFSNKSVLLCYRYFTLILKFRSRLLSDIKMETFTHYFYNLEYGEVKYVVHA